MKIRLLQNYWDKIQNVELNIWKFNVENLVNFSINFWVKP